MIVVKVGGGTSLNIDAEVADIVALKAAGTELLLVHGGAQTTNQVAEALGHPPQFVTSETGHVSRRTDRRTLEIFEMVYCGQLNKMWVEKLQRAGVNAVGLSGLDGRIFEGERKDGVPLAEVEEGARVRVLRFENEAEDLLHYLKDTGLQPGLEGTLTRAGDDEVVVDTNDASHTVTRSVAETVSVVADPSPPPRTALPDQLVLGRERYGR